MIRWFCAPVVAFNGATLSRPPGWVGCELDSILPCRPKPVRRVHFQRAPVTVDIREYELIILGTTSFGEKCCRGSTSVSSLCESTNMTHIVVCEGITPGCRPTLPEGLKLPGPTHLGYLAIFM